MGPRRTMLLREVGIRVRDLGREQEPVVRETAGFRSAWKRSGPSILPSVSGASTPPSMRTCTMWMPLAANSAFRVWQSMRRPPMAAALPRRVQLLPARRVRFCGVRCRTRYPWNRGGRVHRRGKGVRVARTADVLFDARVLNLRSNSPIGNELMRYIRVRWKHNIWGEPVLLFSELSDDAWEIRKVEEFRDGTLGFASESCSQGSTQLSEAPLPDPSVIASDQQFEPVEITKEEFERVWKRAQTGH